MCWWGLTAIRFYEIHDAFNQGFTFLRINTIVVSVTNIKLLNPPDKKKQRYQYQRYQNKTVICPAQKQRTVKLTGLK
jgi:steroid 5-alpha reductase family enzyme